jgi:hypothetical protein
MRALAPLAAASAMLAAAAFAQTTDFTSFEAVPGTPIEIGNYAAVGNACAAGAPPAIKVVESPRSGTLSVRAGERIYRIPGCPPVKMQAEVLTYEARDTATGTDHVVYDIVSANGQVSTKDVTIHLQDPPRGAPAPKPDIKL